MYWTVTFAKTLTLWGLIPYGGYKKHRTLQKMSDSTFFFISFGGYKINNNILKSYFSISRKMWDMCIWVKYYLRLFNMFFRNLRKQKTMDESIGKEIIKIIFACYTVLSVKIWNCRKCCFMVIQYSQSRSETVAQISLIISLRIMDGGFFLDCKYCTSILFLGMICLSHDRVASCRNVFKFVFFNIYLMRSQ